MSDDPKISSVGVETDGPAAVTSVPDDRVGFDDFLDDLFGMNIKGLKSLWVILTRPSEYFAAALTPKWQGRYTPSFRVWFAIMAVGAALSWIWAGPGAPMFELYDDMFMEVGQQANEQLAASGRQIPLDDFDTGAAATTTLRWTNIFLPFGYLVTLSLVAFMFRSWGRPAGFIVRLRLVFATIIPSALLGFLLAGTMSALASETFQFMNLIGMAVMVVLYAVTAYRGTFHDQGRIGIGRTLGLTFLIFIAVLIATFIALIPAVLIAINQHIPAPVTL